MTDNLEKAKIALSKLAMAFQKRADKRQYGVNCAWHVLNAIQSGESEADAIRRVLRDYVEDEGP